MAARCGRGGWRRQSLGVADSRAFHDGVNGVCGDILKRLDGAVWPADFDCVHFFSGAQAEVEAQIVLREVTSSAADFAELLHSCGANGYARTDSGTIALRANQLKQHAMITVGIHIFKERRWFANVEKQHVNIASIENVTERGAAPRMKRQRGETSFLGDPLERAVTIVAMQQQRLAITRTTFQSVYLRINVTIGD